MYLACADPVLDEYEAIAKKHAQNIIDAHHALPWWKRMNGRLHEQARRGVMRCWQVCAEASDRRIAEMRMLPNAPLERSARSDDTLRGVVVP